MESNGTPTTDEVRAGYVAYGALCEPTREVPLIADAFDRWVADRDAEVIRAAIVDADGSCERHAYLGAFANATCESHGGRWSEARALTVCDRVWDKMQFAIRQHQSRVIGGERDHE